MLDINEYVLDIIKYYWVLLVIIGYYWLLLVIIGYLVDIIKYYGLLLDICWIFMVFGMCHAHWATGNGMKQIYGI